MEPQKLVEMIIEEFGPLATSEEEKLIFEIDGCLLGGVMILVNMKSTCLHILTGLQGALHLTTRRIAFHASICTNRPCLATPHQPLKSGIAVLHRKNRHGPRRVWLELTGDTLSVYRSSSDEAKSHPMHTILRESKPLLCHSKVVIHSAISGSC